MRIALVVTGGLHPSGREQAMPMLLTLVGRLAREHDVHAFAVRHLPQPSTYRLRGATVHDLGRPGGLLSQWRALVRGLRSHGPFDVIHGYWADPAGLLASMAGKRLRIPSVVTCDSGEFTALPQIDYGLQRTLRRRWLVRIACELATAVHVSSEYMEGRARQHGVRTIRIPLGVAVDQTRSATARSDGPPWRLLQVAGINRVKDQLTLLRALLLARRTVDVHLDVIGEDSLGGRLQRAAESLGVAEAVAFHGFVPQDDHAPFHQRAHLYVQSSLHEAAGYAVLEAAATGLPIIGTRVGYVSDWDGAAAVAVQPGDPQALADAITDLLQHPDRRHAIARAASEWTKQYDADYTARALSELYRSLT